MTNPTILFFLALAGCPNKPASVVPVPSPPPTPIGTVGGGRLVGQSDELFGFPLAASDIDCDGENDLVVGIRHGARVYNGVLTTAAQPWVEAWWWPFETRTIYPGPDIDDDGCHEVMIGADLYSGGAHLPASITLDDQLPIRVPFGFGDYDGDGRDDIWSGQGPRFGPAPYPDTPPWTLSETIAVRLVVNAQQERMLLTGGRGRVGPVLFHQPSPPEQRVDIPLAELVEHTWPFAGDGMYGFSVVEVNDQPGDELAINTLDRVLVYPTSGQNLDIPLVEWSFADEGLTIARIPTFADFNGDGFTDAFLIPVYQPPWMGLIYLGPLAGQLTLDDADLRFYGDPTPSRAAAHLAMDVDHDGRTDLVIGDPNDGPVVDEALPPGKVYLLTWDDLAPHLVAPP